MHNLMAKLALFSHIAKTLFKGELDAQGNFRKYPKEPKSSDIQIIALAIYAEAHSMDSENWFYRQIKDAYPDFFATLPHRTNYNRRKKKLQPLIDRFSQEMAERMTTEEDTFLIDSMPLPICRKVRSKSLRIMHDDQELLPASGYQPIDRQHYFGYKLHSVCTQQGVVVSYYLTPANVHDVRLLKDLSLPFLKNCMLIADKGYISREGQLDLFKQNNITLKTPARSNMPATPDWKKWMGKKRKRIETLFSQFCDQMLIKRNYAKTFNGFFARITAKIAAYTLLQFCNFRQGKPIGQIKHALLS